MKKTVIAFIYVLTLLSSALARPEVSGYYRNYMGVFLERDQSYSILQNVISLDLETSSGKYAMKASPHIYSYDQQATETGVREAYVDLYFDSVDLRIGKQQIIWGKGDGVFITDVISPKDLSEFLLPDFEEIRIGITAIKFDYYLGESTLEIVGVPAFTGTQMPAPGSAWALAPSFPITPIYDYAHKPIPANIANSEWFAKFSALSSRMDYELMLGRMWDDDPTMHVTKTISGGQVTSIIVTPRHHRLNLIGGSFGLELRGFVVRGEAAYYTGKYINSDDPMLAEGVVEKDYVHSLVGLDGSVWGLTVSTQLISKVILEYDDQIANDEVDNMITIMVREDLRRETLHLELFSYIGLNNSDALIRPKVSYDLDDSVKVIAGANLFVGTTGSFGNYDSNDMLYSKVQVSF